MAMNVPVVFFSGIKQENVLLLMRACKAAAKEAGLDERAIAFSMATENNMDWTVRDLVKEVGEEHIEMLSRQAPSE